MQLPVNILETAFEILVFLCDVFLFGLKVVHEELIELVFAVGQDETGTIVFDFLNEFEPVLNLLLINFSHRFALYFLLKLCDGLLAFAHLIFVLVLLVVNLGEFFICLLLIFLQLLTMLIKKITYPP